MTTGYRFTGKTARRRSIETYIEGMSAREIEQLLQLADDRPGLIRGDEGRPERSWHFFLVADVDRHKVKYGGKVQRACKFLSQDSPRYRGMDWRTLRNRYYANKK
jgi:hypothetical protein